MHHAHAAPAAAVDRFDDNRQTDFFRERLDVLRAFYRTVAPRHHFDTGSLGLLAGIDLIAEHFQMLRTRTDKTNPFRLATPCEFRIFR